ncbi:XrtA/PEP-CTERM system exopolysaccharide export protein [Cellvibrio japonicus]|nr:XrtA/PEP-CTERM system exopolysaccharide export protein [Cellvibrio japonicus]QEI14311.1 sugar ABC transporter substrate-binding protein [Cellvibrio japonicus]QEI17888.1 sugar ABC transporter substrate-binding protein [Cellvibrio japonicus]QEI21464.1 sugar ABC transporter substrate-binding protein [Cellvibrio japonicus]
MPPVSDSGLLAEYRIGVGDTLQINVWRNPELSLAVPVRPDGKISMPLIGDIPAADLTATQLSNNIVQSLTTYVRNPQVTVIVTNPSSSDFQRRVRITGAVNSPQSIPYREGMTVLDLVLLAGGTNIYASPNKARLYRKIDGVVKVYPIRLDDLINDGKIDTNYLLQPSDIVTVPERAF